MKTSDTKLAPNDLAPSNTKTDHMTPTEDGDISYLARLEKSRKYTKIILIITDIIYLLLIPISLVVISITLTTLLTTLALPVASTGNPIFGGMLMKNMSSANIGTYVSIFSLVTWPFVFLLSIIVTWIFYYFKMYKASLIVLSLPVINFIFILLYVI